MVVVVVVVAAAPAVPAVPAVPAAAPVILAVVLSFSALLRLGGERFVLVMVDAVGWVPIIVVLPVPAIHRPRVLLMPVDCSVVAWVV